MILHFIDYLIVAAYFLVIILVGLVAKRRVTTSEEFLTSKHSVPLWATSLAFIAANLGAQELIGMCASGAKYGMMTFHFYWGGAILAMIFVGVFMMPFYCASKARSVPEYLRLRFDEKTRGFNAISFAAMTVFSSGVSLYGLGILFQLVLGWRFSSSVWLSALIVLLYTATGGLRGAVYNEVVQFFLIIMGCAPLTFLLMLRAGGWRAIMDHLPEPMTHVWKYAAHPSGNPMGVDAFGLVAGLGFVLAFGYWCTDFLVLQRAMAAKSVNDSRLTPLYAAFPKMLMPFIIVVPGLAAVGISKMGMHYALPVRDGRLDYDQTIISLMAHYYPQGMVGLGITALLASFMSGMAGNVTAFNTVWTYDIYQSYIRRGATDKHYLLVARLASLVCVVLAVATAYLARSYNNIMDVLQLAFGFVNAPLFATFLLGMFWKRATANGAFAGLVTGTVASGLVHGLTSAEGKGGWLFPVHTFPTMMAQNFWIAIFAFSFCFLTTIGVSLLNKPRPLAELHGLVYGATSDPLETPAQWTRKPAAVAFVLVLVWLALNVMFW